MCTSTYIYPAFITLPQDNLLKACNIMLTFIWLPLPPCPIFWFYAIYSIVHWHTYLPNFLNTSPFELGCATIIITNNPMREVQGQGSRVVASQQNKRLIQCAACPDTCASFVPINPITGNFSSCSRTGVDNYHMSDILDLSAIILPFVFLRSILWG